MKFADDLGRVVVGWVGVDDDPEVPAGFIEVGLLECSDFYRRIHEAVIVIGKKCALFGFERTRDMPVDRHMTEMKRQRGVPGIDGVHQNLSKIQKRMMRIQLRAEWSGRIRINLVFDNRATGCTVDLPTALMNFADFEGLA